MSYDPELVFSRREDCVVFDLDLLEKTLKRTDRKAVLGIQKEIKMRLEIKM